MLGGDLELGQDLSCWSFYLAETLGTLDENTRGLWRERRGDDSAALEEADKALKISKGAQETQLRPHASLFDVHRLVHEALMYNWRFIDDVMSRDRRVYTLVLMDLALNDRTNDVMHMMNLALSDLLALVDDYVLLRQVLPRIALRGKLTHENILVGWSRHMLLLNLSNGHDTLMVLLDEVLGLFDGLYVSLQAEARSVRTVWQGSALFGARLNIPAHGVYGARPRVCERPPRSHVRGGAHLDAPRTVSSTGRSSRPSRSSLTENRLEYFRIVQSFLATFSIQPSM